MSFEFGESIRRSGLEKRGRRAVLEALACYTDGETGLARVSHVSLALHTGLSEKTVGRVLDALILDPDMDGLVRCIRKASGRGNPAVYKVDLARLDPLSSAIKIAGRRVFAGVGKRLCDKGLNGAKASPDNIRAVFDALLGLLREEDELTTARTVEALKVEFEAAMAHRAEIAVIGRALNSEKAPAEPVESEPKGGHNVPLSGGRKGDMLTGKGDILTSAYNKDSSPSGNITLAREAACGKILVGAAVRDREFLFEVEGLLAYATLNRRERHDLIADLQARSARITRDGILAIRARDQGDAEALARRWLEPLLGWAGDVGLAGVVFDAAFTAPPESADAGNSPEPGSWGGKAAPEPVENTEA